MTEKEPSIPIHDCQICFDTFVNDETFKFEQCGHRFCKECATNYVRLKVVDGVVYPRCCYVDEEIPASTENKIDNSSSEEPLQTTINGESNANNSEINRNLVLNGDTLQHQTGIKPSICGTFITHHDILNLLSDDIASIEKYIRFKYCQENKDARECPQCGTFHIGNPTDPKIVCGKCNTTFCFFHSNAHNFDKFPTCEEYENSLTKDVKDSEDFIKSFAKPCPGCHMMVIKSGGCNHMKCKCGVAFCWICGKQIEDTVFPAHFQWWNPGGCANMQLNEAIEPSQFYQVMGRILAIIQMIIFGPITLVSVLISSVICLPCICIKLHKDKPASIRQFLRNGASNCMSGWGLFWMLAVTMLPLAIAVGGAVGGILIGGCIMVYPCYFVYRVSQRKFPLPGFMITCLHRTCYRPIVIAYEDYRRRQAVRHFNAVHRKHLEEAAKKAAKSNPIETSESDLFQELEAAIEDEKCQEEESKGNLENRDVNSIIVEIESLQEKDDSHPSKNVPDESVTVSEDDHYVGLTDIGEIGNKSEAEPSSILSDDIV